MRIATDSLQRLAPLVLAIALMACGAAGGDGDNAGGPDPLVAPVVARTAFEDLVVEPGAQAGTVELAFKAPPATGAATAYEVRVHIPHLLPDPMSTHFAGNAPIWPASAPAGAPQAPQQPGADERLVLRGLEPGQTVQVSLRAMYPAGPGPFAHGVGVRVPGPLHPALPRSTIDIDRPQTLDRPGTYRLTRDISAPGTAFTITAQDVTLDLGGHTVVYGDAAGTSYGVFAQYLPGEGQVIVRNGTLRQGAARGTACPGVQIRGGHAVRLSGLTVETHGDDTSPIEIFENPGGTVRVDHCRVSTSTEVVADRHFPGVAAIWLGGITQSVEIDHNEITASPQWGIKVQGNQSHGHAWIHHNRVVGTKSRVANAYMIGVHKAKSDVFENELVGESRGIHIDGQDNFGNDSFVHDNVVRAQDLPNREFPQHWTHGIKVESARNVRIYHNQVVAAADAQHTEAIALDVSLGDATGVVIVGNRFHATSDHGPFLAKAFNWSGGAAVAPADVQVGNNVFKATDYLIQRSWGSAGGGTFRENVWERDNAKGANHDLVFERIDVSDQVPSPGHRLIDPRTTESTVRITEWANPAAYDTSRWATLSVIVRAAGDAPVAGATVTVRDRAGGQVGAGTTDSDGIARFVVRHTVATNGPTLDLRGPFTVDVAGDGGTYSGAHAVTSRAAIRVTLGASSTAARDAAPPAAPTDVLAHALSATRFRVRWQAPADASGIAAYEVLVNGERLAYTNVPEAVISGMTPATGYDVRVRAIDAGGNPSPTSDTVGVVLPPDDRGP